MLTHSPTIPFYLMETAKEFNSGRPPEDPKQEAAGLKKAIEVTKRKIEEYKAAGFDTSELEWHLKVRKKDPGDPKELGSMGLEQRLEEAQKKIK